jgi:DNA-binding NarL/FixJ family response regulator|tara:strand:+ start:767 stop:1222 length:456 start_codon:yes stop_codon:yes gene_type:complete
MLLYSNTKVLIIEDEEMFRTILVRYCQMWDYSVVGSCDNGRDGLIQTVRLQPELVLIDIDMPEYDGLDVIAAIQLKAPPTKTMIITNTSNGMNLPKALKLNVSSIIDKRTDSFDNIGKVIPDVLAGKKYFSPTVRDAVRRLYPESVSVGTL